MPPNDCESQIRPRDVAESKRLRSQHRNHVENLGYVIHPVIMENLPSNPRIADIGTGTGVWLLHAAEILPRSAELVGYDISAVHFPVHFPSNVSFKLGDVKKAFPETERGTYDLVHVRALILAMLPRDWRPVMRNIVQLLKPGGAVQWTEGDLRGLNCLRGGNSPFTYAAIPRVLATFRQSMGSRLIAAWERLPEAAGEAGLQDIGQDIVSSDKSPALRESVTRTHLAKLLSWAEYKAVWPTEEIESIRKAADIEIENGAYIHVDSMTVTGFKPAA